MVLHLLKRDLRHTAWWLVAMLATLTGWCALPWVAFAQFDFGRVTETVTSAYLVLIVAHLGATIALVRRLVSEDAPLRDGVFWRTRPLKPGVVLASKLIYVAVFVVGLPTLATLPWGLNASGDALWGGLSTVLAMQAALAALAFSVATLSRSVLLGLAVVVGAYFGLTLLGFNQWLNEVVLLSPFSRFRHDLAATRGVLSTMLVAGTVVWAVWRAYARGEQRHGLIAVGAAVAAGLVVQTWWPWALLPAAWTAPGSGTAQARPEARAELEVTADHGSVPKNIPARVVTVRRKASDERVWWLDRVESSIEGQGVPAWARYPGLDRAWDVLGRGPSFLAGKDLPAWATFEDNRASFVAWVKGVSEAPIDAWSGRLFFEEGRLRERAVSVAPGAASGEGADRMRVASVVAGKEMVRVMAVDVCPMTRGKRLFGSERIYLLVNDERGEAFADQPSGRDIGSFYVQSAEWVLSFERKLWGERSDAEVRAWLAGARLVRLTYEREGRFYVDVEPVKVPVLR